MINELIHETQCNINCDLNLMPEKKLGQTRRVEKLKQRFPCDGWNRNAYQRNKPPIIIIKKSEGGEFQPPPRIFDIFATSLLLGRIFSRVRRPLFRD